MLTIAAGIFTCLLPAVPQPNSYHHFADSRLLLGVPNFWNVISNFPFIVVGLCGLQAVGRGSLKGPLFGIYISLFAGVILTGLGSAYYHLAPNNDRLVWDRLPMTIVFMSLFSAIVAEMVDYRIGCALASPSILVGIFSVLWWHHTEILGRGDLRLYGFVQFYPTIFIPLILFLYYQPSVKRSAKVFTLIVIWYVVAKFFEVLDWRIYNFLPISGHTLKHLAAAISTYYFIPLFNKKYSR